MLTQTTITAIRTLTYLGLHPEMQSHSIRRVAEQLGESPTYLAKVTRHLVKAGLLRASYGVMGGIELNRPPKAITLLAIVEACQGRLLPDSCQETPTLDGVCAFHVAVTELHRAMIRVLDRWTLADFLHNPGPSGRSRTAPCLLLRRPNGIVPPAGGKRSRRTEAAKAAAPSRRQAR